ncbi:MAG: hypothetical protein ACI9VS_004386 [Candidatus Binatia bacterium]|jgi:hypothetical protein
MNDQNEHAGARIEAIRALCNAGESDATSPELIFEICAMPGQHFSAFALELLPKVNGALDEKLIAFDQYTKRMEKGEVGKVAFIDSYRERLLENSR